jgi:hypothetical protein
MIEKTESGLYSLATQNKAFGIPVGWLAACKSEQLVPSSLSWAKPLSKQLQRYDSCHYPHIET